MTGQQAVMTGQQNLTQPSTAVLSQSPIIEIGVILYICNKWVDVQLGVLVSTLHLA